MTNYNERLDEILARLHQQYEMQFGMHKQQFNNKKIKQAITSLIKELVAEAKPSHKTDTRGATQNSDNAFYHTKRARGYNEATREFEQNLLKALEEVK